MKKVLVSPHVGQGLGHYVRTLDYVAKHRQDWDETYLLVPKGLGALAKATLGSQIRLIEGDAHYSVTSKTGSLNVAGFDHLVNELKSVCMLVKPTLLVGDPGVVTGIVACELGIPWIGIMHGCYLPAPQFATEYFHGGFAMLLWKYIQRSLDYLVSVGTDGKLTSWEYLRSTGRVVIPSVSERELWEIGIHEQLLADGPYWEKGRPAEVLITCCSGSTVAPPAEFLDALASSGLKVVVAGIAPPKGANSKNITYVGKRCTFSSLVDANTMVITHCGHGTLQVIDNARQVVLIPGDVDQLYNAILRNYLNGWSLLFDRDWLQLLAKGHPYVRYTDWSNIAVRWVDGQLRLEGFSMNQSAEEASVQCI